MTASNDDPDYDFRARPRDGNGKFQRGIDTVRRDAAAAQYMADHPGTTFQQLADLFGYYDRGGAWRAIQNAKADVIRPAVERLIQTESEQLDDLYLLAREIIDRNHVVVSHGRIVVGEDGAPLEDDGPRLQAIQTALRIRESYRKLHGVDQPAKTEISGGVKYELVGVDPQDLV
ncbi:MULTISPECIES: hypothetical protein [unclassified Streptomyces]|uniref:hypothetical protein n=1 Tax=unclassified Streptomyces TaxID=2593676 RepID=UPI0004C6ABAC|nr:MULTISPECIES: hypothetical protein [unclassified Streptomyces]KOV86070.1 hypothetical protein ADL02_19445 [Streptomyces sp. NRRL WC-3723]